jgi:hypothetical protein
VGKKSKAAERRITSFSSGKRWRFVKTELGVEYCVDQLRFRGEKLEKLDCYCIEENGSVSTVQLRPSEVEDMSEIAEFLTPSQA